VVEVEKLLSGRGAQAGLLNRTWPIQAALWLEWGNLFLPRGIARTAVLELLDHAV
jgi:hypothetical protein